MCVNYGALDLSNNALHSSNRVQKKYTFVLCSPGVSNRTFGSQT